MESSPVQTQDGRARFPALDPEPPPKPWWRRLLGPVAVVAVVAMVWAAVSFWPSARAGKHRGATASGIAVSAPGRILSEDGSGNLVLSTPAGTHKVTLSKLGTFAPLGLAVSADHHYLADPSGRLFDLTHARPAAARIQDNLPAYYAPVAGGAFADHNRWLVMQNGRYGAQTASSQVMLLSVANGQIRALGSWHLVAADPQAPGAFVVKPLSVGAASSGDYSGAPDSWVGLLDAGHKPVVLATVRRLNKILGNAPGQRATIVPFPSPSGDKVALMVLPQHGGVSGGVVVLSRTGTVLETVPGSLGAVSNLSWSPSGDTFAFVTHGGSGLALSVWSIAGASQTMTFPFSGARYRACVWSPDSASILCGDGQDHWVIARAGGGRMTMVTGPGIPLTWLP